MPIGTQLTLRASVGRGGRNNYDDVLAVQQLLNEVMTAPMALLIANGQMNSQTEAAIIAFQRNTMHEANPTGLIEPDSATLRALNGQTSGDIALNIPASATAHEREVLGRMIRSIRPEDRHDARMVMEQFLTGNTYGHIKNGLNAAGSAQWSGEFYNAVRSLRRIGYSNSEIGDVFVAAATVKRGTGFGTVMSTLAANPELGRSVRNLSRFGMFMNGIAILLCGVEVVNHLNQRRYGPAVAEVYGLVIQIGVPWAGFIDGVQSVAYAYAPGLRGPNADYFFRFMNAVNPIGAGKTGVDSMITVIQTLGNGIFAGRWQTNELDALVERMRGTPMNIFVEFGEAGGDIASRFVDWINDSAVQRAPYRGVRQPGQSM